MRNLMKGIAIVGAVLVAATIAGQAVAPASAGRPADSSHSIQAQSGTSAALAAVLTRSCGDCHSNSMVRGWYTRIPPFSTLMARGAREGRKVVDFSEWTRYTPEQQRAFLLASCTSATLGTMPMKPYLRFRGDARLSSADVETICSAARQAAPPVTHASAPPAPAHH